MKLDIISLRPFIGSKNFDVSRAFYSCLGFQEIVISNGMYLFRLGQFSFYLQNAYVEDWLNNTMLFIEIEQVTEWFEWLKELELEKKYPGVKVKPIKKEYWGEECFVLDPAGALLHFGKFYQRS